MKLRARKELPGSSLQPANSAGWALHRVMLSLHRAAHATCIPAVSQVVLLSLLAAGCSHVALLWS